MEKILREIRQECRKAMNGAVSTSMREYGLDYKLNFGLVIKQIQSVADKYAPSAPLAERLWKETTRELKILSTLIYPINEYTAETASHWMKSIPNQEIREQICINLFQELPFANKLAIEWAKSANEEERTTGYWLLARLLLTKRLQVTLTTEYFNKYIWEDIISENLFIRNASLLVLKHIVRQSKDEANLVLNKLLPYKGDGDPLKDEAYQSIAFEVEFIHG